MSTTMSWVEGLRSAATGGAAIWAAIIATRGLSTWREQLSGRAAYEVARKTLRGVLLVRERIADVRAPFIPVGEMAIAFREAGIELPDELHKDSRADQLVYAARWNPVPEAMRELEADVLEAEVLMGTELRKLYGELRALVNRLKFAIEHHLRTRSEPSQWRTAEPSFENKQAQVLHSGWSPDVFGEEIEGVVARFETQLRPHLMIKPSRRGHRSKLWRKRNARPRAG